jgi:hypothetical protein
MLARIDAQSSREQIVDVLLAVSACKMQQHD